MCKGAQENLPMRAEEPLDIDENLFETTKLFEYAHIMAPS